MAWYRFAFFADKITATGATFEPILSAVDVGSNEHEEFFPERAKYDGFARSCSASSTSSSAPSRAT